MQISNLPRTKVTVKLQNHVTSKLYGFGRWTTGADISNSVLSSKLSFGVVFFFFPVNLHIPQFHHVSDRNNDNFYLLYKSPVILRRQDNTILISLGQGEIKPQRFLSAGLIF